MFFEIKTQKGHRIALQTDYIASMEEMPDGATRITMSNTDQFYTNESIAEVVERAGLSLMPLEFV